MHVSDSKIHRGKKWTVAETCFAKDQTSRPCKQFKLGLKSEPQQQTTVYDQLSRIQLTKNALDELDKRSSENCGLPITRTKQLVQSLPSRDEIAHLKRFSRLGGPDLRDLIGYRRRMAPRRRSKSRGRSKSGSRHSKDATARQMCTPEPSLRTTFEKRSSAYDANFGQALVDVGIYPAGYPGNRERRPRNFDTIIQKLERGRESITQFSDDDFDDFVKNNYDATSEKTVMSSVFPTIRGSADIPFGEDKLFGNLQPLTDGIVSAKPDFYDGSLAAECDKKIRQYLGSFIVPSTQEHLPIVPNFFCEGKGPDGSHAVGEWQALYNGTIGARAMHTLQLFEKETTYDNNAYTITSLYHCGQLELYTVHPLKSAYPSRETDYQMTLLRSYSLKDTCETFCRGVQAFRNARDWTKKQRDHFISTANAIAAKMPGQLPEKLSRVLPSYCAETDSHGSDTSTDELAQLGMICSPRKRRLSLENQLTGPAKREKLSRIR